MNLKEFEIAVHDAFDNAMTKTGNGLTTIYIGHKDYMEIRSDLQLKGYADFSLFTTNGPDFIWEGISGYVLKKKNHFGYQLKIK